MESLLSECEGILEKKQREYDNKLKKKNLEITNLQNDLQEN